MRQKCPPANSFLYQQGDATGRRPGSSPKRSGNAVRKNPIRSLHAEVKDERALYIPTPCCRGLAATTSTADTTSTTTERRMRSVRWSSDLFCVSHDTAVRAGIVYSLFSSCKAHGIDARTWMEDKLKRLPSEKNVDSLLPCNFRK